MVLVAERLEGGPVRSRVSTEYVSRCFQRGDWNGLEQIKVVVSSFCRGIDDITLVLQQNRLRWYGHVL